MKPVFTEWNKVFCITTAGTGKLSLLIIVFKGYRIQILTFSKIPVDPSIYVVQGT